MSISDIQNLGAKSAAQTPSIVSGERSILPNNLFKLFFLYTEECGTL